MDPLRNIDIAASINLVFKKYFEFQDNAKTFLNVP